MCTAYFEWLRPARWAGVWPETLLSGAILGRRSGFGRWPARSGVEHEQGAVRWLATRAGFGPDRNVHEWPPGLARRGTRTGEVAKAVESTAAATTYPFSDASG